MCYSINMSIKKPEILFNYHTHTYRCGHAVGSDEDYVKAAIEGGYKVLGFSDHAPYRAQSKNTIRMDFEQFDGYLESINNLKEKYKDQIEIKIGLESEYIKEYLDEKKELRSKVDYLILGQHYDKLEGGFFAFRHNSDEEILRYANSVCEAIDTGLFTYLAHPDVIMVRQEEFNDACRQAAHIIGKKVEEKNFPVEINIRGVDSGKHEFPSGNFFYYPNKEFWTILAQYNIKAVIGMDVHNPEKLLDFKSVEDGLKELEGLNIKIIDKPFI